MGHYITQGCTGEQDLQRADQRDGDERRLRSTPDRLIAKYDGATGRVA